MAKLLKNGNMLVPKPACSPDGVQGDTAEEITPRDPRYALNIPWLRAEEAARARRRVDAARSEKGPRTRPKPRATKAG